MLFFPLYITAWALSLLLNVNNNNNSTMINIGCNYVGILASNHYISEFKDHTTACANIV